MKKHDCREGNGVQITLGQEHADNSRDENIPLFGDKGMIVRMSVYFMHYIMYN
jgi:hypothetical protein